MVIDFGDGTWQKRLDANQCPKCRHKLEFFATKKLKLLVCPLCKLEIIQRDPKDDDEEERVRAAWKRILQG